jgi:hypothetical protein
MGQIVGARTRCGFGTVIRRPCRPCVAAKATTADVGRDGDAVNALPPGPPPSSGLLRIKARPFLFLPPEGCGNQGWAVVKKPIIVNETEARQATKEGVVRYILMISLVLVIVLFVVAYLFFR